MTEEREGQGEGIQKREIEERKRREEEGGKRIEKRGKRGKRGRRGRVGR